MSGTWHSKYVCQMTLIFKKYTYFYRVFRNFPDPMDSTQDNIRMQKYTYEIRDMI